MSLPTPFTEKFMRGWNPSLIAPQVLVRVELLIPTALTLYWCCGAVTGASPLVVNPGGFSWQPVIIDGDPIHAPGGELEPGPSLCVTGFRIANERLIPQSTGTAADLFQDYVVRGAVVTMWLWNAGISDFSVDAGQCFKGVIQSATVESDAISFRCQQDKGTNVTVPPNKTSKTTEPNAPESSLGLPKPLVYGQFVNDGMDDPWLGPYPGRSVPFVGPFPKLAQEDVGAAGLVIPGVMIDSGVGGDDARVIFADHPLKLLGNVAGQESVKVVAGSGLASYNQAGISAAILGDNSGFDLVDEENVAEIGIPCVDVRVTGVFNNLALNPRAALEVFDETTYATVQSTGAATRLALITGNVGSPGKMLSAKIRIGYETSHTTTPAKIRYNRPSSAGADPIDISLTTHTTAAVGEAIVEDIAIPVVDIFADPNNEYAAGVVSTDWNTAAGDILVFLNPATAGHWIHIRFVGLVIKYQPSQSLVAGEVSTAVPTTLKGLQRIMRRPPGTQVILSRDGFRIINAPAVYEAQGQFYANCQGREDTTGDSTDTVDELIERPMDIIHHLLTVYGGEPAGNIETAINRFGSFSRARPRNTSIEGNPISLGVHVGAETPLYALLSRIAQQAPGWLYRSRFDNKWKFIPWDRRAPVADFPRTLEAADILEGGFQADALSETQIVNDVSVGYAYDYFRNRALHSANVNASSSDGGFASRGKRDQLLKIETSGAGQNNKLDLVRSATTYAATLNGATYTPAQMMVELKRALTALAIGGAHWNAGWGGTVVAGHNDKIDFTIGGTTYLATVAPGGWLVGEMAHKMQLAMRAVDTSGSDLRVGLGMYVLAGVNDALDFQDPLTKRVTIPPGYYRDGAHLARTIQDSLNSQSSNWTCTYNTGTQKFTIGRSSGTASLLWLTGTSVATSVAPLLGYAHGADDTGASSYVADYARNRARIHIQGTVSVMTMRPNTGANRATSIAVSAGWDQTADSVGLNYEATYSVQDETFALSEVVAFSLPWQSGASAAISVAHVLGFKVAVDDAALTRHLADRRRSDRETRCVTSRTRYGPKETENVVAVDVRATEVAINLRDTVIDLLAEGPVVLRVKTHRFPDLERGRIVPLGDLSSLVTRPPRYGAGAWAGKLFRAVEVAQHWGRAWHQEIVLMEEQNPLASLVSTVPDEVVVPAPFFVAWTDERVAVTQVYVQKITIEGAAAWTANGVVVSAATSGSYFVPRCAVLGLPDDGCVVLYMENISGTTKVRAQRFDKEGTKLWGSTGVEVSTSTAATDGYGLRIVSDELGGFYFGWHSGTIDGFYVRRCASDGTFPWAEVLLGNNTGSNDGTGGSSFELIPDGANGVYGIWHRATSTEATMGQRVAPDGSLMWSSAGVTLAVAGQTSSIAKTPPRVPGFVFGGVLYVAHNNTIASWSTNFQIRRIDPADGSEDWITSNLDPVSTRIAAHTMQTFATAAGIYGLWWDDTGANGNGRIMLVDPTGAYVWANPITFATRPMATFDSEISKQMVVQSGLGVIIIYHDPVDEDATLKAVRVDEEGNVVWGPVQVSDPTGDIEFASACSDGEDGAVITYSAAVSVNDKLYAVRLKYDGTTEWGTPGFLVSGALTNARKPAWVSKVA